VNQLDLQSYISENTYEGHTGGLGTAVGTADRRRSARAEQRIPAWLSDAADGGRRAGQRQVQVTDLSMHGVGFQIDGPVDRGASHWIVIATDRMHLSTRVRIVSVRPNDEGGCDVGAEFF
jgi:hypothetical protein